MKYSTVCITGIFILLLTSCASKKNESVQTELKKESEILAMDDYVPYINIATDHSFLDETMEGSEITIKGLLKGSLENGFTLTENFHSKGAVTFFLTDQGSLEVYQQLPDFCDSIVTIKGILTKASSRWTKEMSVLKLEY